MTGTAIGIDLGATNIKGVLLNEEGQIIHEMRRPTGTDTGNPEANWRQVVAQMIQDLKSRSVGAIDAIGLAAPGLPNDLNTAIRVMPERLKGLEGLVWADYLHEKQVCVLNDAHAALMAEARFGAGQGIRNLVMLTLGTGVGGGIVINGTLYQGNYQMAGHLGHMTMDVDREDQGITGMPGTLENAIGDASVSLRSFGRFTTTHALVEAYRQRDSLGSYVWLNAVRKLALALCSLCNVLSPDMIILGGGITKAGDALYGPLADFMDIFAWHQSGKKTPIRQAMFQEMAGAVGAAGFALDKMQTKPVS